MAWESLTKLVRTAPGAPEDPALAQKLYRAFKAVDRGKRREAFAALAQAVAAAGTGPRLITGLARLPKNRARYLAALLAVRLPGPLEPALVAPLKPLLADKRLPADLRMAVTAALLRTVGPDGPAAEVLEAWTAGMSGARALKRLAQFKRKVGPSPAIDRLQARIQDQLRMRCPRCGVQLRRPEMVQHLWREHQLVLEGMAVREPWKLVEDWVELYGLNGDATLLGRCQALAEHLDPQNGLLRVYRLFLARKIDHEEGRQTLRDEAGRRGACLCPHCFAWVGVRPDPPARPLNVSRGRIAAPGYHVEVADNGFLARLEVEMPGALVYRGPEPMWRLTRAGATLLFLSPPVLAAFVAAVVLPLRGTPALVPVLGLLGVAVLAWGVVRWHWRPRRDLRDRAVHYAWTLLVPLLHRDGFSSGDSEFLASLALTSLGHGWPAARAETLQHVLTLTEKEVAAGTAPVSHLAVLWRLAAEDGAQRGHDPVRWVVTQVGRCFDGKLPLAFAQHLLADWEASFWSRVNLARLRALLCERAFEAGFEVGDLADLGRVVPALADAMQVEDVHGLLQLRLMWSLRPTRPWDRVAPATTVFELAADPTVAREFLADCPDLILAADKNPQALLTTKGVFYRDTLLTAVARSSAVHRRRGVFGVGYELALDQHRFWFQHDPEFHVGRLMEWLRFYFNRFLPTLAEVRSWRSPGLPRALQGPERLECPECHRSLLGRRGEVGAAIRPEEPAA